jgi:hypothetical protein
MRLTAETCRLSPVVELSAMFTWRRGQLLWLPAVALILLHQE